MIKEMFGYILVAYIISILPMSMYYNWKYNNENSFIKSVFLGGIVPYYKGALWPYFVYRDNVASRKIDPSVDNREIRPHFKSDGIEYIGNYYENHVYTYPNDVVKFKDEKYMYVVSSAREEHSAIIIDKNNNAATILEPGVKINKFSDLKFETIRPDSIVYKIYKLAMDNNLVYGEDKVGKSGKIWRYVDVMVEGEKGHRIYIDKDIKIMDNGKSIGVYCLDIVEDHQEIVIDPGNIKFKHTSINILGLPEGPKDDYKDINESNLAKELLRRLTLNVKGS